MNDLGKPFDFKLCANILKSTLKRARDLRELRDLIATVSNESIFHHTYEYQLKGLVLEYTNDFAHWAGEFLEDRALAEYLSSIDYYSLRDIQALREKLLEIIDDYLARFPEPNRVLPGDEFHFNESVTLVFPAGIRARNMAEFLMVIKYIESESIYYHFFDARIRLGGGVDDFSRWFENSWGKKELAEKIRSIDPFMHTLEGIRGHIAVWLEEELKRDMEVGGI